MTPELQIIDQNLKKIRLQIASCMTLTRASPRDVRMIAVSKKQSAEKIKAAYDLGLRDFGENYIDELEQKKINLQNIHDIHWVYIGQLQSNKISRIVHAANEIQSIASEKHARYVERYCAAQGKKNYPVWIVVNGENEPNKQGVSFESLQKLADFILLNCPHLDLRGVMAIPPAKYSDASFPLQENHPGPELYSHLRRAASSTGKGLLSLGMSGDLKIAIHAGSDCIRVGSSLFGARPSD